MKTYLPGKKSLGMAALAPSAAASRQAFPPLGGGAPVPGLDGGAQIETVKEGDRVVRIIITCACGERVEVECLYPAG
jgi:hypothetical protein